jgi:hypothetical protein
MALLAGGYLDVLHDSLDTATPVLTTTLTTRLRPFDRRLLIAVLTTLLDTDVATPFDDHRVLITSTQLVEAGVDISVDALYRDFAPLASVVQAAGRCNRSFGGETRTVTLWRLEHPDGGDEGAPPSELIYERGEGVNTLRSTRTALAQHCTASAHIDEHTMVTDVVETYYEELHHTQQFGAADLATAVDHAHGERLRHQSVIADEYPTIDVCVLRTDGDYGTFDSYRRVVDEARAAERAHQFDVATQTYKRAAALRRELDHTTVTLPLTDDVVEAGIGLNALDEGSYAMDCRDNSSYDTQTGRGPLVPGVEQQFLI